MKKRKKSSSVKLTVNAVIPPRDKGLNMLISEYKAYKKVLIPRVQQAVRPVIKDKYLKIMGQQKWMVDKKLSEYLKNLPFHPMPFHRQSVWLEKDNGRFFINFKTKRGIAKCSLRVPRKYRKRVEEACGRENPKLGQVEVVEDKAYGWFHVHITLRLPKPEPYQPKGWIGVDVGWRYLAVSAFIDGNGKPSDITFHGRNFKTRIIRLKHLLKLKQQSGRSRKLKVWNHTLENVRKNAVGIIAKEIVEKAVKHNAGVRMEKLSFQAHTKKYLIPRYKLKAAVKTLCERQGVPFELVPARKTSVTCYKCGVEGVRNRATFKCVKCGNQINADLNAALNIAKGGIR